MQIGKKSGSVLMLNCLKSGSVLMLNSLKSESV